MREGMPLIFGWKVDFAKHPTVQAVTNSNMDDLHSYTLGCFSKTLFQKKIRAIPSRTPLGFI